MKNFNKTTPPLITTPGIYHNSDLGLISLSSDGTNWTTIADKNLGATSTDTTSTDSYGNYYQWGNNYGFPNSGSVTSSTTRVNAGNYGPGNYYSSSTFIKRSSSPKGWDSSNNNNLRGKSGTLADKQGPCDTGFHIPTTTERYSISTIISDLGGINVSTGASDVSRVLKLPFSGQRSYADSSVYNQGSSGHYWSCSNADNNNGYFLYFEASSIGWQNSQPKSQGYSIRPFKNEAVQPYETRTKLY